VSPASFLDDLSPYARVTTAIAPFVLAVILRLVLGKNRLTRILFSISATWLVVNVMLAPYSLPMQRDLRRIGGIFR